MTGESSNISFMVQSEVFGVDEKCRDSSIADCNCLYQVRVLVTKEISLCERCRMKRSLEVNMFSQTEAFQDVNVYVWKI